MKGFINKICVDMGKIGGRKMDGYLPITNKKHCATLLCHAPGFAKINYLMRTFLMQTPKKLKTINWKLGVCIKNICF